MSTTTFNLTIGDWSDDGHGKADRFTITANKTLEEVREAYFTATEKLPKVLCPENFMDEYEDYSLPQKTYEAALALGYDLLKGFDDTLDDIESFKEKLEYPQIAPSDFCDYVLWFIRQGDETLVLTKEPEMPDFHQCGFDEKKRHIGQFGYGLYR